MWNYPARIFSIQLKKLFLQIEGGKTAACVVHPCFITNRSEHATTTDRDKPPPIHIRWVGWQKDDKIGSIQSDLMHYPEPHRADTRGKDRGKSSNAPKGKPTYEWCPLFTGLRCGDFAHVRTRSFQSVNIIGIKHSELK